MAKHLTDEDWNKFADLGASMSKVDVGPVDEGQKREMLALLEEFGGDTFLISKRMRTKQRFVRARIARLGLNEDRKRLTKPERELLLDLLESHGGPEGLASHLYYSVMGLRAHLKLAGIEVAALDKYNRRRKDIDPEAARAALEKWDGNVRRAAMELNVSYTCLYTRLDALGLRGMTDKKARRPLYRGGRPIPPDEEPEAILQALDARSWDWQGAANDLGASLWKLKERISFLNLKQVAKDRYELWKANNPDRLRQFVERANQPLSSYVRKGPDDDEF